MYNPYQNPYLTYQNQGIIWVSGEAGAKAYLVAPNSTVQLWDSEAQTIYLKSADSSGMPSMKILDYTIRGSEAPSVGLVAQMDKSSTYATKTEIDGILAKIEALRADLDKMKEDVNG